MLKEEIKNNISKTSNIDLDTIQTPKLSKIYSNKLPKFKNLKISPVSFVNKCLLIKIINEKYLLLEGDVMYYEEIKILKKKIKKPFLFVFKINKKIYETNEEDIYEKIKQIKEKNKKIPIKYEKHYDSKTNSVLIFFTLKTYYIANKDILEEVDLKDFKSIKNLYLKKIIERKKKRLEDKINTLGKTKQK